MFLTDTTLLVPGTLAQVCSPDPSYFKSQFTPPTNLVETYVWDFDTSSSQQLVVSGEVAPAGGSRDDSNAFIYMQNMDSCVLEWHKQIGSYQRFSVSQFDVSGSNTIIALAQGKNTWDATVDPAFTLSLFFKFDTLGNTLLTRRFN